MSQGYSPKKIFLDNLKIKNPTTGQSHLPWYTPYQIFSWKQNELYRQLYEYQMEHLRKVYKRQWYEAYRVNADEYLSVYAVTKAAQMDQWEKEMISEDKRRRDEMYKREARRMLKQKQKDITQEYYEKHFFYWYERASERIQAMSLVPFVKKEDMNAHILAELSKYTKKKNTDHKYPLNFLGQMPIIEDENGEVAEIPFHMNQWYQYTEAETKPIYGGQQGQAPDISSEVEEFIIGSSTADGQKAASQALEDMDKFKAGADKVTAKSERSVEDKKKEKEKLALKDKLGGGAVNRVLKAKAKKRGPPTS